MPLLLRCCVADEEMKPKPQNIMDDALTPGQRKLKEKHGTPAEFAKACYEAVPGFISMDEAEAAIKKYNAEWALA